MQVPDAPVMLHDSHSPEHRLSQQYPSVQKPLVHSESRPHVVPGSPVQKPVWQVLPAPQTASSQQTPSVQ